MSNAKKNIEAIYELSPMQQGMLFHTIYNNESDNYFEQLNVTLVADLNIDAFKQSWEQVINRYSVLRTSFVYKKLDKMLQVVHKELELPFKFEDWSDKDEEIQLQEIENYLIQDKKKGFNLSKAPLQRIKLIKLNDKTYKLIWSHHHILLDGWSLPLILRDLFIVYEGQINGNQVNLPNIRPYQDYIKYLKNNDVEKSNKFWETYLEGFTEKTQLSISNIPFEKEKRGYSKKTISLNKKTSSDLNDFARNNKLTLNTVLQAGWAILLHKYGNSNDVVFGATFSGRPATLDGAENMVGLFINSLPIRAKINSQSNILDWILEFNSSLTDLKEYESSALVDIQKASELSPKENLFDSLFVFENYPVDSSVKNSKASIKIEDVNSFEQTNFPLTIVSAPGENINIDAAYSNELIPEFAIDLLLKHYKNILQEFVLKPNSKICEIEYLTNEEQEYLIPIKFEEPELIKPWIVIKQFEEVVKKFPNNIAVSFNNENISYNELNKKTNKLAHLLVDQGVLTEDLVGFYLDRKIEMIISILAILKTGAGYVPIDFSYPKERVEHILSDSKTKILLTESTVIEKYDYPDEQIILIDTLEEKLKEKSDENLDVKIYPENIAYVIYTSGSTGKPKGTVLQNKSVYNFIRDFSDSVKINEKSKVLQFASIGFDASVPEIFTPLLNGGCVQLIAKELIKDLSKFNDFVINSKLTNLLLPPSVLATINYFKSPYLKTILSAGEACPWNIVEKWSKGYRFINGYGPTEATVGCTWGSYSANLKTDTAPIGIPIYNVKVYVLDSNLMPVPIGVPGELYVGENALARGYLNKPALSANKFIPNPFSKLEGERIYQTRDLVKILPDGQLEFLGRIDNQVKLRGFRIELGEIESVLNNLEQIEQAIVVVQEVNVKKLVAFIKTAIGNYDISEIKKQISVSLPKFMIPSHIKVVDEFPLTSHGKVDRKKLTKYEIVSIEKNDGETKVLSATEDLIITIFKNVLKVRDINVNDNFFDLGGHSLLATQLVSRIREAFEIDLPINNIFELETIQDLASEIDNIRKEDDNFQPIQIKKYGRENELKLSYSQQRMWFFQKFDPENISNNIFTSFSLKGNLDVNAFKNSISNIINRHEILKTFYVEKEGKPLQEINSNFVYDLPTTDISDLGDNEINLELSKLAKIEATKVFNLSELPLFRMLLVTVNSDECVFMVTMHHIISDGWSIGIMIKELAQFYQLQLDKTDNSLKELNIQYADFAQWQKEWLSGDNLEKQLEFWSNELSEIPELIDLPIDKSRPSVQTFNGNQLNFEFSEKTSKDFTDFSKSLNFTPFMVSLATFNIMLHKYSNQNTVVVGSAIANRNHKEIENLIGFFVNTLVLRTDFNSDDKVVDVLKRVREKTLKAYAHQDLPFEQLVDKLQPNRDMSHSPLFQVAFIFQNSPTEELKLPGLELKPIEHENKISKYDLSMYLQIRDEKLFGTFEYNTDLFEEETIGRMKDHFINILNLVISNPKQKISRISLLSDEENKKLVSGWNNKKEVTREQSNVAQAFSNVAKKNSDETAITFSEFDDNVLFTEQLSYKELDEKTNQLARYLINKGVKSEDLVGVSTQRSLDLMISIIAILKTGGAFVPIDPNYPNDRIDYMISDSNMRYIITQEQVKPQLDDFNGEVILIDVDRDKIETEEVTLNKVNIDNENSAYVIYTSGTTGKPKGTLLNHKGLINLAETQQQEFNITNKSNILQFSSLSFDAFVWETVMALLNGASLNLVTHEIISSGEDLVKVLKSLNITTVTLPPSVLSVIPKEYATELENLKTIIVAGEKCSSELVNRWSNNRQFVNAYGPTETTVCASMFNCSDESKVNPPIGKAINNFDLYVLDKNLNPVPIGIPGELYISGAGLARGYHKKPELSAEKFIPNPFSSVPGNKMYKSGDLVKYLSTEDIEFIGRVDNQVKLRGFRIELGEIESVISSYVQVNESLVMVREDLPGLNQLVTYITPSKNISIELAELRTFLRSKLPEYMVPVSYVILEEFPLTPSKKIDFKALPIPDSSHKSVKAEYVEPRNETEKIISDIGKELLGIERMGIHDNFFELGGHSLLATQFISKIKTSLNKEISLKVLFEHPTISEIVIELEKIGQISEDLEIENQSRGSSDLLDLLNDLENISDEEAKELLAKEIKSERQ